MNDDFEELKFGSSIISRIMKILIGLFIFFSATSINNLYGVSPYLTFIDYLLLSLMCVSIAIILYAFIHEYYVNLTSKGVTYTYIDILNKEIHDYFEWDEIERFENINSFIFFKKIRIVLNHSYSYKGREVKIWIRNSEIPIDTLCDILNENLSNWKKRNSISK